jgi:SulP family sulfate permease
MLGGRYFHPLFPAVALAVGLGLLYANVTDYSGATIGPIPEQIALPSAEIPLAELPTVLIAGIVIAFVGFIEPSSIARTFAAEERRPWNENREFAGQGAANVAAGLSGGFPVGGSFSRSALGREAGARTRWSGALTGVVVLACLPFASVLAPLPTAVLGAIVIGAVASLIRPLRIIRLARFSWPQFSVASATFVLTLVLAPRVDRAVLIGVALAVSIHLYRELSVEVSNWREADTLHVRPRGVLWFGASIVSRTHCSTSCRKAPVSNNSSCTSTALGE